MKKIVYILFTTFFLLLGTSGIAQSYELTIGGYVGDGSPGTSCGSGSKGLQYIEATYANGTKTRIFDPGVYENKPLVMTPVTFNENNKIVHLRFHTNKRRRNSIGNCKSKRRDGNINITGCYYRDYNFSEFSPTPSAVPGNAIINVRPIITLNTSAVSDIIGYEDSFEVTATAGFNTGVYKWQYQLSSGAVNPNGTWQNIPLPAIPNVFRAIPQDFLPKSAIGQNIYFRILPCADKPSENIVSFRLRRSAPHIVSPPTTTDVSCYDSIDGEVRVTFDRALEPGDNLGIAVSDMSRPIGTDPDGNTIYAAVKSYSNISLDGTNSYVLTGLPPSTAGFKLDMIGGYNGFVYYTGDTSHTAIVNINKPTPVSFEVTEIVDVWCNDGDTDINNNTDGEIHLSAAGGGTGQYEYAIKEAGASSLTWLPFVNASTHIITGLKPVTYEVQVRKKVRGGNVYCVAREQINVAGEIRLGDDIVESEIIEEPGEPLQVELLEYKEPTAYGFLDGFFKVRIFGGTALNDDSYTFEWKDNSGNILTTTTTSVLPGNQGYQIILHSIGEGVYNLSARDANYNAATYKDGCFFTNIEYNLEQPEPLEVTIEIYNPISCNIDNEYSDGFDFNTPLGIPDQFQDGALVVHAKGGVKFDNTIANPGECRVNFMPYCYRWKKNVGGVWQNIAVNDSIIENQSVGNYALNVEDKNGIVLGTYEAYTDVDGTRQYRLVQAIDSTKYLSQPDKLGISFTNTVVTCANGDDAEATTFVVGGTPPYTYEWSNGETTPTITNLIAGTYLIFVTDAKGCQIEGSVKIDQPGGLEINPISVISPTCFEGNDGQIEVEIKGGNPPYNYTWSTGSTSTFINGLSSGTYRIEVTDNKGCKAFYEEKLIDPDPIIVNLEEKRSLCKDQSLILDIAINDPGATYSWFSENGFTSSASTVEITEAGRYVATITSSLGCIGIGDIEVEVFDTPIDSDFLITTQAYTDEEVILVNVSEPIGETVEWTIPEGVEVVLESKEKLILKFEKEGPYDINLRSYQIDCYQDFTKTILVQPAIEAPEQFASQGEFIEEFIVYPNPNGGSFKTKISLAEESNITLKIVNLMSGATMHERVEKNNLDFLLDYSLTLPTGVYLMLLETPKGSETRKLVFE
ncbi:T9SS type A sorting domain-containing protein [Aquimarina macrocephali]|uniref:T9SS type A sorting domain-containing protein n=1 Tax=Aquimarina macrocephali TaxID=666563 RepID=UPI000465F61E|nr:T9SS type A sorting domain-containing protein [Aquimarina macrocephali]